MRILYWTEQFWPSIGGVEVLSAWLLPALRAQGHEFCVVTSHGDLGQPDVGEFQGIPVHRFSFQRTLATRNLKRFVEIQQRVAGVKRAFKPDVVHVNYCDPSVLFHMRTNDKVPAATLLSIYALHEAGRGATSLQSAAFRFADWVAAPSTAILAAARVLVPEIAGRSSVVHCSTNERPPPAGPLLLDPPRLLCVGRLAREKGFDIAISAFAAVAGSFPGARLVVSGDGPERAALVELAASLGVADRVEFAGWAGRGPDQNGVFARIAQASIVIMPSRWLEPFGLVALHAAQCGRPVIAARTGGLTDIVADGETGLLFERENAADLARAIAAVLRDPQRARAMGSAALRRASEKFAWQPFVAAHDELYRRLGGPGAAVPSPPRAPGCHPAP